MSMQIAVSDQIAEWIATYGDVDASSVWQRCMDAQILTTQVIGFNVLVTWNMPEVTEKNAAALNQLIIDGIIDEDLYPIAKTGEVIRWKAE